MGKMKGMLIDMMNEDWERCHLTDEIYLKEMQLQQEKQIWDEINKEDGTEEIQTTPGARSIVGRLPGFIVHSGKDGLQSAEGVHEIRKSISITGEEGFSSVHEQRWDLRSDVDG